MKSVTVGKNDAGQRVDRFLMKTFPQLPVSMLYKYIRQKDIKRNGKRCQIADRLAENDVVTVYAPDEFLEPAARKFEFMSAGKALDILYEDEHLLLLNKPAGLLVHPDEQEYSDTLIYRIQRYLYEKGAYQPENENSFVPSLVNRIDRNTCGIVIAAKTAVALRVLNEKLRKREIEKYYLCLVHGHMEQAEATLHSFLVKNEAQNRVYVSKQQARGSRAIATYYRVLEEHDGLSLLEVELLTGRTHQIRAQLAAIGHPLLGDGKYGTNALNKGTGFSKQALCSYRLKFSFSDDTGELNYLNGKEFSLDNVWFVDNFRKGTLKIDR